MAKTKTRAKTKKKEEPSAMHLAKCPTGIRGLDEITEGGLPRERPTLVCGAAGAGKTQLAMEFLVRGAVEFGEPGIYVSFEETEVDLIKNTASHDWDLARLARQKKLLIEYFYIEPSGIEETGEYDLEGLFIRLLAAVDSVGARRIALDTIEALFGGFTNETIMRAEIRRLFRWLKKKHLTAIITGEPGDQTLTRHGLEEYVSDCVIQLDHRILEEVATRRLRIVKYRGSGHGSNEYPFLIGADGISILPITSIGLDYQVSTERVSTGVDGLDAMLGGSGCYRGTSILVSGTSGTGKSSLAASFVDAACRRGERALYLTFEEAPHQIIRNMSAIGLMLEPWVEAGLLKFKAVRSTAYGLEMHLAVIHQEVNDHKPAVAVVDPVSNLGESVSKVAEKQMLSRMIDFFKMNLITAVFTNLTSGGNALDATESEVSSLMDTWILLRDIESCGERNRGVYVLKSRGMAHSNQIREFLISDRGIRLCDVYVGAGKVLTGTARTSREAEEKATALIRQQEMAFKKRELERKREAFEAQAAALRAEFQAEEEEQMIIIKQMELRNKVLVEDRKRLGRVRGD